nr:hypothetical protein [Tanacetum cinerariifolium]
MPVHHRLTTVNGGQQSVNNARPSVNDGQPRRPRQVGISPPVKHTRVVDFDEIEHTFNLDPNVRFNLSFNLLANERDITNDDDVEFFIDCAANSITDEIPHLYIRPPKVEARIIPGPVGILQKALA